MQSRRRLRVVKKGYHRKAYVARRHGKLVKVKPSYVPPTTFTIKDIGAVGRGERVISKIKKGLLRKFGYSTKKPVAERHNALRKAYKAYGGASLFKKLQVQVVLRKRTQPKAAAVFKADRDWVKESLMTKKEKLAMTLKPRKAWVRMPSWLRKERMPERK